MVQGEASRVVLNGLSWPGAVLLVAAAALIVWFTWRALRRGGSTVWAACLLALRAAALLGLAFALLQPQIVREGTELLQNRIVVLCDGSMSMGLPSGVGGKARQEIVRERLGGPGGPVASLAKDFELQFVEFGHEARSASGDVLSRIGPGRMPRTDLRGALRAVAEKHGGEGLRGVVLVSDGADTELPEDAGARRELLRPEVASLGAPVFAFCPVDASGLKDIAITKLRCPRLAFVRSRWEVEVDFTVLGITEGTLTIQLRRGPSNVDIRHVRIEEGRRDYTTRLGFMPTRTGKVLLSVEIEPHPEETCATNNAAGVVLSVVRDKIRVLQVAGRPSWDVRFLRRTFEETPTVDLVSFFILRDTTDETGEATPDSYVNLIPFPTQELFTTHLETFDVIVFQNFDYRLFQPYEQDFRRYLTGIRKHVEEGGAGFVMVGGDQSFDRGGYAGTDLAQILAVVLSSDRELVDERQFRARMTLAGRRHPVTRIEDDEKQNASLWDNLPELQGCHVLPELTPGAVVLLDHPVLESAKGGMPIVAVKEAGQGRTLAVTTDETWRWNFEAAGQGLGNRVYLRFWHNALRWLVHDLGGERVTISVENPIVAPAEEMRGTVRILDADYAPQKDAKVALRASMSRKGDESAVTRELTTDKEGIAPFALALPDVGVWCLETRADVQGGGAVGEEMADTAFVSVEAAGREMKDLRPDEDLLRWLAEQSGGAYWNIARDPAPAALPIPPRRVEKLVARDVTPLWNNWITYGIVVGLLCAEWWMRRKRGVT